MVLGVTQGADFKFFSSFNHFSWKWLNKLFLFWMKEHMYTRKKCEKWNFWLKLPLGRLFLSKNMPHRQCTHFVSNELRAHLKIQK